MSKEEGRRKHEQGGKKEGGKHVNAALYRLLWFDRLFPLSP
jgi:hypothetical protein